MKFFLLAILTLLAINLHALNAYAQVRSVPLKNTAVPNWSKGELIIFPLSSQHLAVGGYYTEVFKEYFRLNSSERLSLSDRFAASGELPEWAHKFFYNYAAEELQKSFYPVLKNKFDSSLFFTLQINGAPAEIEQQGYWLNSIGTLRLNQISGNDTKMVKAAEIVPFTYFKLKNPLKTHDTLTVQTADGNSAKITFNEDETVCRSIKINQNGYAASAGKKYAYLGMWLGNLGAMPTDKYCGKNFYLKNSADNQIEFTGKMQLRSAEQFYCAGGKKIPLNGETVLEMDFSSFKSPGKYYISIPEVGRSFDFSIDDKNSNYAFYITMRGLLHQRCGAAKPKELTQWDFKACHKGSYKASFVPNDRHYKAKSGCFKDENGRSVSIKPFDLIKATATNEFLPEVYGGWHDAGDFDRRMQHFDVVEDLVSLYLLFPHKFTDGQLDLPESGNKIPDILDEAVWGMDVWRKAQNAQGGVGCWIEAVSHPENSDPDVDVQRYYLALPTCESSLRYSAYAAKLALALRKAQAPEMADKFYRSARLAFQFAVNPANHLSFQFNLPKLGKITYTEPENLPPEFLYKAAFNLYAYSNGDSLAAQFATSENFSAALNAAKSNPFFLSEMYEFPFLERKKNQEYRTLVALQANEMHKFQAAFAYRNLHYPPEHKYFKYLGWGNSVPFHKGRFFIIMWAINQDKKCRDALYLLQDWMLGANPMGRSMVTSLGQVYPVRLLSLPNWSKEKFHADPIPGLVPYTYNGENSFEAMRMLYTLNLPARPDCDFTESKISLLPKSLTPQAEFTGKEAKELLVNYIPYWRKFTSLEGYNVRQNEYTVNETISPAAIGFGALVTDDFKVAPDWKNRTPTVNLQDLPGWIFLP